METAKRLLGFCKTLKGDKPNSREELEARARSRGYTFSVGQLEAIALVYLNKGKNQ